MPAGSLQNVAGEELDQWELGVTVTLQRLNGYHAANRIGFRMWRVVSMKRDHLRSFWGSTPP